MNKKRKLLFISIMFSTIYILIPISTATISGSVEVPYLQCAQLRLFGSSSTGSYSAMTSIQAYIINNTDCDISNPIWAHIGSTGDWDVVFPGSGPWYIAFVNTVMTPSVPVYYEFSGSDEIPGFELIFAMYILIGLISILGFKKNLNL